MERKNSFKEWEFMRELFAKKRGWDKTKIESVPLRYKRHAFRGARLSLLVAEAPAGSQHSRYIPLESAFLRFGTL